jgi:hypothetical protein
MKDQITQWYVRVKFKHKVGWDYKLCRVHPPFSSKQAAEEYAQNLFGVEKWEVKELRLRLQEAQTMERVRQFFADYRTANEDEADSGKPIIN